jgi:hypothetical protein
MRVITRIFLAAGRHFTLCISDSLSLTFRKRLSSRLGMATFLEHEAPATAQPGMLRVMQALLRLKKMAFSKMAKHYTKCRLMSYIRFAFGFKIRI